jgi:FlaA1/EpsC-like NDP-sugar epimerase
MEKLKNWRVMILLLVDAVLVDLSYVLAFYFRFTNDVPVEYMNKLMKSSLFLIIIYLVCLHFFNLYKSLWIYASIDEFLLSVGGCIVGGIFASLYWIATGIKLPYSISILATIFSVILIVGFRLSFRIYRRAIFTINRLEISNCKRVLVIGAGSAGIITINEMKIHSEMGYIPVGIIDDEKRKIGTKIFGVKVIGDRNAITKAVEENKVDEILIAIPSLQGDSKKELIKLCNETGCKVKILPGIYELIDEKVTLKQIRDVNVEDLLGREQINLDCEGISKYLEDKTVLITGGGGSIGSELCRQVIKFKPKKLLILDSYENNAYNLYNELKFDNNSLEVRVIIATIIDKRRMEKIFQQYKPEIVFHAAAHKHVPLMEDNPTEAIKNNVFGTLNLAECAHKFETEKFVMISTDKAVNPTNVMGASKRMCEMIVQAMNKVSKTEFVAVRFGNVLGSNGSVIPLFKNQIANGGPVTVTNQEVTRFFMTIPEASQLVLQAGAYAEGGEIFVLNMGEPVKIYDLACDLIKLSGFEPHKDIKIEITGLRPGEKLYEELLLNEENLNSTKHSKIFVGQPIFTDMDALRKGFEELKLIIEHGNKEELLTKINELVPTYKRTQNESTNTKAEIATTLGELGGSNSIQISSD